ncbi:hypothetical protein [Roseibium polysiphoniae]|uniref:Uncharacterized protein n=1 Tax=Roseibium polysiphoniae TaxID=2571221 RepID=A0ABR9C988_9HYPH|nr:hypothetical protein [Roseibium polysiphoniae]MBD8876143.1 hypothetical protein [Roseibium polysiphoniae]
MPSERWMFWRKLRKSRQPEAEEILPPRRKNRDLSDARALLGAIALGLTFAVALTIAASWAPESFAERGSAPSEPALSTNVPHILTDRLTDGNTDGPNSPH